MAYENFRKEIHGLQGYRVFVTVGRDHSVQGVLYEAGTDYLKVGDVIVQLSQVLYMGRLRG